MWRHVSNPTDIPCYTRPMIATALLLAALTPTCPTQEAWLDGDRASKIERDDHRRRVRATCEALGASAEACDVVDVIAVRESSGDACAVHVLGPNEYGLGAHGLSWKWHQRKWYADVGGEPDIFRLPEVSTIVTMRLMRQAARRRDVRDWGDVGEIFAGRVHPDSRDRSRRARFCHRLAGAGVDCRKSPRGKLGKKLGTRPTDGQEMFVLALLEKR